MQPSKGLHNQVVKIVVTYWTPSCPFCSPPRPPPQRDGPPQCHSCFSGHHQVFPHIYGPADRPADGPASTPCIRLKLHALPWDLFPSFHPLQLTSISGASMTCCHPVSPLTGLASSPWPCVGLSNPWPSGGRDDPGHVESAVTLGRVEAAVTLAVWRPQ